MPERIDEALRRAHSTTWDDIPPHHQDLIRRTFGPSSLGPSDIVFLYGLNLALAPLRAVEIGLADGSSSVTMALAAKSSLQAYDVMDPFQWSGFKNRGLDTVRTAMVDSSCEMRFFEEMSHIVLPRLLEEGRRYDYALIDASHKFDLTMIEVFYIDCMLEVGGVLVMDDRVWPMVGAVVAFMQANYVHLQIDTSHPRLTVVHKVGEDKRSWFD